MKLKTNVTQSEYTKLKLGSFQQKNLIILIKTDYVKREVYKLPTPTMKRYTTLRSYQY